MPATQVCPEPADHARVRRVDEGVREDARERLDRWVTRRPADDGLDASLEPRSYGGAVAVSSLPGGLREHLVGRFDRAAMVAQVGAQPAYPHRTRVSEEGVPRKARQRLDLLERR